MLVSLGLLSLLLKIINCWGDICWYTLRACKCWGIGSWCSSFWSSLICRFCSSWLGSFSQFFCFTVLIIKDLSHVLWHWCWCHSGFKNLLLSLLLYYLSGWLLLLAFRNWNFIWLDSSCSLFICSSCLWCLNLSINIYRSSISSRNFPWFRPWLNLCLSSCQFGFRFFFISFQSILKFVLTLWNLLQCGLRVIFCFLLFSILFILIIEILKG